MTLQTTFKDFISLDNENSTTLIRYILRLDREAIERSKQGLNYKVGGITGSIKYTKGHDVSVAFVSGITNKEGRVKYF